MPAPHAKVILLAASVAVIAIASSTASRSASGAVDVVYAATEPEGLYFFETGIVSLDLASGKRTWLVSDADANQPALSADGRTLAFASDGIWIAESDGTNPRKIVDDESANWPALSPDGRRLAYSADDGLRVVGVDGDGNHRIHPRGAVSSWSPDSRRLVFDERTRIYLINADGTGAEPLTDPGPNGNDDDPAWSPNGDTIAFVRSGDVYTVSPAGGTPLRRTRTRRFEAVSWSANSRKLVFERSFEIYSMNVDGTAERRLTRNDTQEGEPIWGSNDRMVIFEASPDSEVFALRGGAALPTRLTDNDASDGAVAWSPRGDRVAFASGRGGSPGIYLMRANGAGQRRLARTTSVQALEWSPSGAHVLATTYSGAIVVSVKKGSTRKLAPRAAAATWSPDGRQVAYVQGTSLFVVGVDGTGRRRVSTVSRFDGDPDGWPSVDWSSRGQLAFEIEGRSDLALRVVAASGKIVRSLSGYEPRWSPDGGRLAYLTPGPRGDVVVLRPDRGTPRGLNVGPTARSPRWSRDGRSVVVAGQDGIWQITVDGTRRVRLVHVTRVGELDAR